MSASSEEIELLAADAFALFEEEGGVALEAFLADHPEEAGRIREALEAVAYFDAALAAENEHSTIVAEGGSPPPPMPAIRTGATDGFGRGTRVGDFVIQGELGRGGMGIVYRARQRRLQREVALKVLPPEFHANSNWTKRFVLEARSAARLSHPSIVTVYDAGSASGICYLAMELIEGESLAQVMRRGLLLQEWAVEITRQIAGALMVLHETGLLHRDVKPANIMLAGPRAKLMDFGLVTDVHDDQSLTRSGVVLGTPAYMSPEQIRGSGPDGSGLDGRSDIYSLGVVLFEGLCGYLPHDKERTNALLAEVRATPAPIPQRRGRRLPRDLETIVLRCLEKDPANRYQDAGQLEEDLGRFSRGEPILARPIPALVRVARRVKQNPVLSTAIAGAVVVFLVASYLLVHLDSSARIEELERQAAAAEESARASLAALEALRETQRQERATAANQLTELASARAEADRLRPLLAASEERLSDEALIGIGRARQLLESGNLAAASQESDRLIADGAEHALLTQLATDVGEAQQEAQRRAEAAELAAREAEAARRSTDQPVVTAMGAAEREVLLARASRLAEDRKFRAAALLLAEGLPAATAGGAPAEFGREAQVYAAAAAYMARIEGILEAQIGEELTLRAGSSGKQQALLVGIFDRDGERFLDLKLGSGGLSFPFLRLSEEDLLEWGKSAPAVERAGFLLASGRVAEAVQLGGDMDGSEPVAVQALARHAEVKLAPIRRTFPDAEVTLVSAERMQVRWDFAMNGDLPVSWQFSPARQWSVTKGVLRGRGMIAFQPPLPPDTTCVLDFAEPGTVQVEMGGEPLAVVAAEPGSFLLRRAKSELTLDRITVQASEDLLRLRTAPDRDTVMSGVTFEMPTDEEWVACISEPRNVLARYDWARASAPVPEGATLRDLDGEGRCLELVSKQRERPRPPADRPGPPPDRGPGGPPGRGPEPRRPEGPRPLLPPDAPDEVELTLPLDRIAFAPGARIDIEIRIVGSQRGKPTGKLSLQGPDHTARHSSSVGQIDKGVWQTVRVSTVMLQPSVVAGEAAPSALQIELQGSGSFTAQLRSLEISVAAE